METSKNPIYKVVGRVFNSDEEKTLILHGDWGGYSATDAMDYCAMFFNIAEFKSVEQGTFEHGYFVPSPKYKFENL